MPKRQEVNGKPVGLDFDEIVRVVENEATGNIVEVRQADF